MAFPFIIFNKNCQEIIEMSGKTPNWLILSYIIFEIIIKLKSFVLIMSLYVNTWLIQGYVITFSN